MSKPEYYIESNTKLVDSIGLTCLDDGFDNK